MGQISRYVMALDWDKARTAALLGLILAGALALRLWGISFGLPGYVYHPDEPEVVERAFNILRTGNLNPGWFHYPSGYIYTLSFSFVVHFLLGATRGFFIIFPEQSTPDFYLAARATSALFGAAIVLVAFLLGRSAGSRRAGMIAAAFVACSYLSVVNSHYGTADLATGFWTTLCGLFAVLMVTERRWRWHLLAGAMAGIAAGVKYNAGLCLIMVLVAHLLSGRPKAWERLAASLAAAAGAFLLTTPFALLDLRTFLNGIGFELNYANHVYHAGYSGGSLRWYLTAFLTSADAPLAVFYGAGLIYAVARPRRARLVLWIFAAAYLFGLARSSLHFERYVLPVIPILSVLAALFLDEAAGWLAGLVGGRAGVWAGGLTAALIAVPLAAGVLFDGATARSAVRQEAGAWVVENVAPRAKIAIEHYAMPLPISRYQLTNVVRLWDHPIGWYRQEGFDYAIASNGIWTTLHGRMRRYPEELNIFKALWRESSSVQEFIPQGVPALVTAGYPTIAEYHFPRIWVFHLAAAAED